MRIVRWARMWHTEATLHTTVCGREIKRQDPRLESLDVNRKDSVSDWPNTGCVGCFFS